MNKHTQLTPGLAAGGTILVYIVASLVCGFLAGVILSYASKEFAADNLFNVSNVLLMLIVCPIARDFLKRAAMWRWGGNSGSLILKHTVSVVVIMYLYNMVLFGAFQIVSAQRFVEETLDQSGMGFSGNLLLQVIGCVIAAPLVEEVVFRGAIFGGLRKKKSFVFSAVVSSLIFGAAHGLGLYTLIGFAAGLLLCAAYEATKNMLVPMLIHIANNGIALLASDFSFLNEPDFSEMTVENKALLAVLTVILIGCVYWYVRQFRKDRQL